MERRMTMNLFLSLRCRAVQAADSLRNKPGSGKEPLCRREPGGLADLGLLMQEGKASRPLVLMPVGPWSGKEELLDVLKNSSLDYVPWELSEDATEKDAENIRLYYIGARCDSFIALGDERLLCAAKLIAARAVHPGSTVSQLAQKGLSRRLPPLLAIPTQIGAAALSSRGELGAVSLKDSRLRPKMYIQDENLLGSPEPREQAELGMELLCRCLEELVSPRSKGKRERLSWSAEMLLQALENLASGQNIRTVLFQQALDLADCEGGYAWALAQAIGEQTEMSAGRAAAVCLPTVLEAYARKDKELTELFRSLGLREEGAGTPAPEGESPAGEENTPAVEPAPEKDLLWRLRRVAYELDLPESYEAINFKVEIDLAQRAAELANPHRPCPAVWDWKKLRDTLRDMKA